MVAREIAAALAPHGFREVQWPRGFLLELQTFNINRAVVVPLVGTADPVPVNKPLRPQPPIAAPRIHC
jgi:hypothetical protein